MTDQEIAGVVAGLTGHDADLIASAWQSRLGRWYVDGPCRHLYALGICRLDGRLTADGLAVRAQLMEADRGDR